MNTNSDHQPDGGFADPARPLHVDRRFRALPFGGAAAARSAIRDRPVDVLTTTLCAPLLDYMPGVRKGIVWNLPRKQPGARPSIAALADVLRAENYGSALVMPRTWKSALAPYLAGIPERTGFAGEARFGLLNDLRWGERKLPRMIDRCGALALPRGAHPAEGLAGAGAQGACGRSRAMARAARPCRRSRPVVAFAPGRGRPEQALAGGALRGAGAQSRRRGHVRSGCSAARTKARSPPRSCATAGPHARDLTSNDLRNAILALKLAERGGVERFRPGACRRRRSARRPSAFSGRPARGTGRRSIRSPPPSRR